jgi:hypothetical protein
MDVQSRRDGCGLYVFAQFMLDVPERDFICGVERIHLAPKTFDVLVALAQGRVTRRGLDSPQ